MGIFGGKDSQGGLEGTNDLEPVNGSVFGERSDDVAQDDDHLRLLSIFHYVVGGLAVLFALFPVLHLVLGLFLVFSPEKFMDHGQPPPAFIGWLFVGVAAVMITAGWTLAALLLTTAHFLARQEHYMFCLAMACVECLFVPFGTALGVFTIIVLTRESVKQQFAANVSPGPTDRP
jgi:hypothetical protein